MAKVARAQSYPRAEVTDMAIRQTRSYGVGEFPKMGDVVQVYEGSFGDAVVDAEWVRPDDPKSGIRFVLLRPHMMLAGGTFVPVVERVPVELSRIREMPVYVTGASGRIENRNEPQVAPSSS